MQKHTAWLIASVVLIACGRPGVVEKHRIKGSEMLAQRADVDDAAADGGEDMEAQELCPTGWTCMDIAALGFMAEAYKNITTTVVMDGMPIDTVTVTKWKNAYAIQLGAEYAAFAEVSFRAAYTR